MKFDDFLGWLFATALVFGAGFGFGNWHAMPSENAAPVPLVAANEPVDADWKPHLQTTPEGERQLIWLSPTSEPAPTKWKTEYRRTHPGVDVPARVTAQAEAVDIERVIARLLDARFARMESAK